MVDKENGGLYYFAMTPEGQLGEEEVRRVAKKLANGFVEAATMSEPSVGEIFKRGESFIDRLALPGERGYRYVNALVGYFENQLVTIDADSDNGDMLLYVGPQPVIEYTPPKGRPQRNTREAIEGVRRFILGEKNPR